MTRKAQFSNLRKFLIAVIIFAILAYLIAMWMGALPTPAEIVRSIGNRLI